MAENKIRFDIEANSDAAQKAVASLRKQFDITVNALKKQQGDIAIFKSAQQDAARLEAQIQKLSKAGGNTTALTQALNAQRAALAQQDTALRQAGINTAALSSEQTRLRIQVEQATRTFRQQAAVIGATKSTGGINAQTAAILASGKAAAQSSAQVARYAAALLLPAASAAGFVSFVKKSIDAADRLNDLRQITGLTVPTLNGLAFAAKQSGTDLDALAKGVGKFARVVDAAKNPTSEQSKLLNDLGISAKLPEAALLQISDTFAAMPDGLEKTNLAMELFGKSGADLIPLLNGGSAALKEMITTGQTLNPITQEMAEKADEFNDSLGRLKASGSGLGTSLAASIVPGLTEITKAMEEAAKEGGLLKTLWVGLGGVGAAIFTDEFKSRIDKIAKAQRALNDAIRNGATEDSDYVIKLRAKIAALEQYGVAEKKAKDAADQSAKAAEARNATQKTLSENLVKTKQTETEGIKAALDAQTQAYREAQSKVEKVENDRIALAEKNKKRLADLQSKPAADLDLKAEDPTERFFNQAKGRTQLNDLQAQATNALTAKDFDKAIELGEKAAELITALSDAGADSASGLAARQRAIADLQDKASVGKGGVEKAKADEAKASLDAFKKEFEAFQRIPVGVDLAKAEAAIMEANKRMQALLDANPLRQPLNVGGGDGADIPGRAHGGLIRGPGSGTSDSILARLSNNEYVVRAAAVKKLGLARLNAINEGRLPGFAEGGLIARSVAGLPSPSSSPAGGNSNVLNLTVPGMGTFETSVTDAVAAQIERKFRVTALKHGRRT